MLKNKRIVIVILIMIFVVGTVIVYLDFLSAFKENGLVGIGYETQLIVGSIRDYRAIENPEFSWSESEKKKMIKYMKNNNLLLAQGIYKLNEATSYERALEIFQSEENKQ